MTETQTQITQLIPAPGWKAMACAIDDDNSASFWEVPVIGWGIVRNLDREAVHDDHVELFVFDEYVHTVLEGECSNSMMTEIAPGHEFDDEDKADLERRLRYHMKLEAEYRAKRAKAEELHAQGVPGYEIAKQTSLGIKRVDEVIKTFEENQRRNRATAARAAKSPVAA